MSQLFGYTIIGLVFGAAYAITASGLVLTYAASRVFNVAHGAVGMVMAFVYWELAYRRGLPAWLAAVIVVCVVAPAFGALVERYVMRGIADAPVAVSLVVTAGLLVALTGFAEQAWPPGAARFVRPFFPGRGVRLGSIMVSGNQLLILVLALAAAGGLYIFLTYTTTGLMMRASVDDRELLGLYGGKPHRMTSLGWALGSSMAALAGILLVSVVGLDYYSLTLLVISAYAAAMVGRMTNLPRTFLGGLLLGVADSYAVGYLPVDRYPWLSNVGAAVPTLFLFAALVVMPHAPLRVGRLTGIPSVRVPSRRQVAVAAVTFLAVAGFYAASVSDLSANRFALAMVFGIIALSLMPLAGFSGYISMSQLSFAGVGALVVAKTHSASPLALLLGALVAAAVGVLVALPALRLQGLYLALSTLAFAELMDKLLFQSTFAFGYNGSLPVKRMAMFGMQFRTEKSYAVLTAVVFVAVGAGLVALRRGRYGRLLIALRDSPAACATLGLNPRFARVAVFALSAGIAGLAGGLFGGVGQSISALDFHLFYSLLILLFAVVAGMTSVTGAALAGIAYVALPTLQGEHKGVAGLLFLVIGVAALSLGRQPNGIAGWIFSVRGKVPTVPTVPTTAAMTRSGVYEPAQGPGTT